MSSNTLAIPFGFMLLAVIILWIMTGIKGKWWIKSWLILVTSYFSIAVWMALHSYMGWSTTDPLPAKYQVFWIIVYEPRDNDEGAIHVWLRSLHAQSKNNLFEYSASIEPRAYKLQYSRELHEQAQQALGSLKQGRPVVGGKEMMNSNGSENAQSDGDGGQGMTENAQKYFWELPPSYMPTK